MENLGPIQFVMLARIAFERTLSIAKSTRKSQIHEVQDWGALEDQTWEEIRAMQVQQAKQGL